MIPQPNQTVRKRDRAPGLIGPPPRRPLAAREKQTFLSTLPLRCLRVFYLPNHAGGFGFASLHGDYQTRQRQKSAANR